MVANYERMAGQRIESKQVSKVYATTPNISPEQKRQRRKCAAWGERPFNVATPSLQMRGALRSGID
jgi:hypothetical protein